MTTEQKISKITEEQVAYKGYMMRIIREHQHYDDGELEEKTFEKVSDIFYRLLGWIGD